MNWNGSVTGIVAQPASLGEACSIIALRGPAETRFGVAASGWMMARCHSARAGKGPRSQVTDALMDESAFWTVVLGGRDPTSRNR